MEYMIIITGIWIAILPYMKWSRMGRGLSLLHIVTGVFTCISIIIHMINDVIFSYIWVQASYIIVCILLILEIITKFKGRKAALDVLAIATAILGLILSIFVFLVDPKEISSSIIMVVGPMIVLSIPFNGVQDKSIESKK